MIIFTFIGAIWIIVIVGFIVQSSGNKTRTNTSSHINHCSGVTIPLMNNESSIDMSTNTIFTDMDSNSILTDMDSNSINPTTGLPMLNGCIDVSGTPLGMSDDTICGMGDTFCDFDSFSAIETSDDMFS